MATEEEDKQVVQRFTYRTVIVPFNAEAGRTYDVAAVGEQLVPGERIVSVYGRPEGFAGMVLEALIEREVWSTVPASVPSDPLLPGGGR